MYGFCHFFLRFNYTFYIFGVINAPERGHKAKALTMIRAEDLEALRVGGYVQEVSDLTDNEELEGRNKKSKQIKLFMKLGRKIKL